MGIESIIVRKTTSHEDRLRAATLLNSIDIERLKRSNISNDFMYFMYVNDALQKAAKLFGFIDKNDMMRFTDQFGMDALFE